MLKRCFCFCSQTTRGKGYFHSHFKSYCVVGRGNLCNACHSNSTFCYKLGCKYIGIYTLKDPNSCIIMQSASITIGTMESQSMSYQLCPNSVANTPEESQAIAIPH